MNIKNEIDSLVKDVNREFESKVKNDMIEILDSIAHDGMDSDEIAVLIEVVGTSVTSYHQLKAGINPFKIKRVKSDE